MAQLKPEIVKYAFITISALEVAAHALGMPEISRFTKPLLMPVLLIYFRSDMRGTVDLSFLLTTIALVFAWLGDVLLMYQPEGEIFFILGLSSFSVTQLLYIVAFSKATNKGASKMPLMSKALYAIPFVIFGVVFLSYVLPNAQQFTIPLIGYSILLVSMTLASVYRSGATSPRSHNQVFFGALLFLFSDSLIALNKFLFPMDNPNLFIMSTYILAQWNIVKGLLAHYNEEQ